MRHFTNKADALRFFIASACYLGLSPVMPGSCAALLGLLLHLGIIWAVPPEYQRYAVLVLFLLFGRLCIQWGAWAERIFGGHDHPNYVLDEIAGYLFVPLLVPLPSTPAMAVLGFVLFRAFDITKVFPANIIDQRMLNPWGVLLDDLVSATYAAIGVFAAVYWGLI